MEVKSINEKLGPIFSVGLGVGEISGRLLSRDFSAFYSTLDVALELSVDFSQEVIVDKKITIIKNINNRLI